MYNCLNHTSQQHKLLLALFIAAFNNNSRGSMAELLCLGTFSQFTFQTDIQPQHMAFCQGLMTVYCTPSFQKVPVNAVLKHNELKKSQNFSKSRNRRHSTAGIWNLEPWRRRGSETALLVRVESSRCQANFHTMETISACLRMAWM